MSGSELTVDSKSAFSYFPNPLLVHNRQRNVFISSNGKLQHSPEILGNQVDVPVQGCVSPRVLAGGGVGGGGGGSGGGGGGGGGDGGRELPAISVSSIQSKAEPGIYRMTNDKDKTQSLNENSIPAHEKQIFLPSGRFYRWISLIHLTFHIIPFSNISGWMQSQVLFGAKALFIRMIYT